MKPPYSASLIRNDGANDSAPGKPLCILYLEDNALDAELTLADLSEAGIEHETIRVDKRPEFVAQLQNRTFDVILADFSLPSFDGISALEIAQQLRPEIPFIFVSGVLGEELAIEIMKRGATDYVIKQRLQRLAPSIKRALRESQERTERRKAETALQILAEASNVFASSLDYHTTLANVARLVVPFFADYCIIDMLIADGALQRLAATHSDPAKEGLMQQLMPYAPKPEYAHPIFDVLRTGETAIIPELPEEFLLAPAHDAQHQEILKQLEAGSIMIVPLSVQGRTLGAISFFRSKANNNYSPDDAILADDLARRAALAIDNARLYHEAQEANRAKDEFLATISHELRTPLTAVLGWINLLRREQLDEATRIRALETIERNAKAQAELISDILEVSRIVTGKLRLDLATVDLATIIQAALETARPAADAKQIQLEFTTTLENEVVAGDPQRLQQIVWNLLSNAIKFTPPNGRVQVDLAQLHSQVQIKVCDTGQGIDAEFLPYVFERFRQADSTSTRKHGGLGLGLSIVRHLTELHGGSVSAESPGPGQGATFCVNLPILTVSGAPAPPKPEQLVKPLDEAEVIPAQTATALQGIKILLVEDEADTREMMITVLTHYGAEVTSTASVREAFAHYQQIHPDVLLSDLAMPEQDGYILIRQIRECESKDGSFTPAIAVTAYARAEDRVRSMEAGFQMHVTKPVDPIKLVTIISNLAQQSNPSQVKSFK